MVRSRPSKNIPPAYEKFLSALAIANVPETVIKNRTALNSFRAMKRNSETFSNEVSSTAALQDDVISETKSNVRSNDWEAPL